MGGDEFAVIVSSERANARATFLAEDLLEALRRPVTFKGRILDTRASIGLATYPHHGADASELLKNADIALYAAKSFGRGGFTTYVPSMGNTLRKRASAIATVREAIAQHRLETHYQPKVDLRSRRVIGYEALLRLRDDEGGLIPAHAIDQAFEDIELARQIGDTMFERVANDVRHWQDARLPVGKIALNASAAEFRAGDFAPRLLQKLRRAELSPELFEIEVAETVLAGRGTDYVATALADLADAGLCVALDEFGTGASSLAQLKRLPFHSIKIDRTFVETLEDDNADQAIIRAIVGLADGLGLGTTAVGVETLGQMDALHKLGCNVGQGKLLGLPTPAHAVGMATGSPFVRT
ncbi:bifunctional diguanylate cyclase/phosphodiesterase [Novosphingobium sp. Gsoil 351]|uniref:putative bifunctional diguanylate cyclase/phosphodiesterase n=1 Tax=Novosphingobium sp. Gsoil 351 TaxID=2675225 RepID=UPI0012B44D02|nr:EAL domain-containing protein [Novosphingobium sp. Gsoil 351]